ncbi:hypothetical protein UlMin_010921 [Ulmus minor]
MFRVNPKLDHAAFNAFLKDKYCAEISKFLFYRTKEKALKLVEGSIEDQFNLLHDYCLQLRLKNPAGNRVFERVYVCLAACKKGWIEGCRPVVDVDGCFIKVGYSGQLLSAVGLDANNSIFPVAYAVVEAENYQSWKWFLQHLVVDLEIFDSRCFTFINCEQRSCVRHVYANFKNKFPVLFMKQKLWAAARATTIEEFNRHMAKLKEANVLDFQWLSANPINEWSRFAFREGPKCDILLNNLCESFNSTIVGARHKCIFTVLKQLRDYLMCRMATRREATSTWVNPVGPRIVKIFEKNKAVARLRHAKSAGGFIFQVTTCTQDQLVVNLGDICCSYRQFQLFGIPCGHALACIYSRNLNVYEYVDSFYKKESYEKTYAPIIYPMPHLDRWPNAR